MSSSQPKVEARAAHFKYRNCTGLRTRPPSTFAFMETYGQFCPVALAAEVLTRKWTPLVVRELLCGSTRFNDLRRGVPRMSPSLLSKRLGELEDAGVLERRPAEGEDHDEYHLTQAGRELQGVIEALGVWGKRWIRGDLGQDQLDAELLMWDLRRRVDSARAPAGRTVVRFIFADQPDDRRHFWLVVTGGGDVDLCWKDPGHPVDLEVATDLGTLTEVWMGDRRLAEALRRGEVELRGPSTLRRSFPGWLGLSLFASVEPPAPGAVG